MSAIFRDLVKSEQPLALPGAHDCLSALLIERAGFKDKVSR
jgi:2-methylisocitrate lyase-like PEP mutase family enzyme